MCGATSGMKQVGSGLTNFFNTMVSQASSVFGSASKVFGDLFNTFHPIAAAGPSQEGFSGATKAALTSQAITNTGQQYQNAAAAVKNANAAVGGGNMALPSGADIGQNLAVANAAASTASNELTNINLQDYEMGRENWLAAAKGMEGATNVFNPATEAGNAATNAGNAAEHAQNDIATQNNSWVNAAIGAVGNIAGDVLTGGMSGFAEGAGGLFGGGQQPIGVNWSPGMSAGFGGGGGTGGAAPAGPSMAELGPASWPSSLG